MLIIRLQRVGRRNQPSFRIVLAEKHRAASKKVLEILGHYNPRSKEFAIKKSERLEYWLGQHVEVSATVRNLLVTKGLLKGEKVKAWKPKKRQSAEAVAKGGKKEEKTGEIKPAAVAEAATQESAPEAKAEETKPEEPKS